jgi:NAD(P)-dependent dehydrogenase (short-subunit alcohol dehydrogenase family)
VALVDWKKDSVMLDSAVLQGQKALVTGASSGIGLAVAVAHGQAGADVAVNYLSGDDTGRRVVDTIAAAGSKAFARKADVSDEWRTSMSPSNTVTPFCAAATANPVAAVVLPAIRLSRELVDFLILDLPGQAGAIA